MRLLVRRRAKRIENSRDHPGRGPQLFGRRFRSNAGRESDQRRRPECSHLVEVDAAVDVTGPLRVSERVAEGARDPIQIRRDVAPAGAIQRGALDSSVTHETAESAKPPLACRCVAVECLVDRLRVTDQLSKAKPFLHGDVL